MQNDQFQNNNNNNNNKKTYNNEVLYLELMKKIIMPYR